MPQVIVRDDDISFFCRPAMLEAVYKRLWEAQAPICLSVVPAHSSNVTVPDMPDGYNQSSSIGLPRMPWQLYRLIWKYDLWKRRAFARHRFGSQRYEYDRSIPPLYAGSNSQFYVTENQELCGYLNAKLNQHLVEICLHGYSHEYLEFGIDKAATVTQKLINGQSILKRAFPTTSIQTFIAPHDLLSGNALKIVLAQGFNLCTRSDTLIRASFASGRNLLGEQAFLRSSPFAVHRLDDHKVFICDEYLFNDREPAERCLARARQRLHESIAQANALLILGNHHWSFFHDWETPNEDLFEKWNCFLDELLSLDNIKITTFDKIEM